MRRLHLVLALATPLLASACTGVVTGDDEPISIETYPRMTASCVVKNERGEWNTFSTPEHVDVSRAKGPLTVNCRTPNGWTGYTYVTSKLNKVALVEAVGSGVIGEDVVGGPGSEGGSTVDGIGGSTYQYPRTIVVPMSPEPGRIPDAVERPLPPVAHAPAPRAVVRRHVVHHAPCMCALPHAAPRDAQGS